MDSNSTATGYSIMDDIINRYEKIMQNGDPRVSDWYLMSSPFPTLMICCAYVIVCKIIGPKLMENRKPFDLREYLVLYNFIQVLFNIWIFSQLLTNGWTTHYSLRCQPVDYSNNPMAVRMAHASWWYFFSKFTDCIDTMFFVLRKKNDHISALHLIHHGIMPISVWFGVKFSAGGHSTFFGLVNSFVHIIMYSYYMLSAMGPHMKPFLWWKKYLTLLQMGQFIAIMVHSFQLLFIKCDYPKAFVWWIGLHGVLFYILFYNYYGERYGSEKTEETTTSSIIKNNILGDKQEKKVNLLDLIGSFIPCIPNQLLLLEDDDEHPKTE